MKIARESTDSERPYLNIQPIVDALIAHGNSTAEGGFRRDPSGWACMLTKSIDFDFVRAEFELPSNIKLGEVWDSIHDELTWTVIEGPNTHRS